MPFIVLVIPLAVMACAFYFFLAFVWNDSETKGKRGEEMMGNALSALDPRFYHVMNDVLLPDRFSPGKGTTQIDHIVFSTFGIFVVETKNYSGWIFGNPTSAKWCQVFRRRRFFFQNPYRQNYKHICCLSMLTGLNREDFISVIAFVGPCTVKTQELLPPSFVTTRGELEAFLASHQTPRISCELLLRAENIIKRTQIEKTEEAQGNHVSYLKGRCYLQDNLRR
ncbi:MAG: nuclease-related domain-containing protein [Oligosphaeraceae bacterium]